MLLIFPSVQVTLAFIGALGGVVSVIAAVVIFWKSGGNIANQKTIDALKELNAAQEKNYQQKLDTVIETAKEWQKRTEKCEQLHRENLEKMGHMQGQMETMTKLLENRNPELMAILTEIKNFMHQINTHMQKSA